MISNASRITGSHVRYAPELAAASWEIVQVRDNAWGNRGVIVLGRLKTDGVTRDGVHYAPYDPSTGDDHVIHDAEDWAYARAALMFGVKTPRSAKTLVTSRRRPDVELSAPLTLDDTNEPVPFSWEIVDIVENARGDNGVRVIGRLTVNGISADGQEYVKYGLGGESADVNSCLQRALSSAFWRAAARLGYDSRWE